MENETKIVKIARINVLLQSIIIIILNGNVFDS